MNWKVCNIVTIERKLPVCAGSNADDHIKSCSFPRAVWAKQPNNFAARNLNRDVINDSFGVVFFIKF